MKRFDYLAPASLDEALAMLAVHPWAVPLAGGTDLLVQLKEKRRSAEELLSLKRVAELALISLNGEVSLGSMATIARISGDESIRRGLTALSEGAGLIGSIQIRNAATLGGNLCNASPSADTAPPLLVLGAKLVIASSKGERTMPLEDFFTAPGQTVLQANELLKAVILPPRPTRSGSAYLRHTPRSGMDLAFAGVAAALTLDEKGRIASAYLAMGAVAPTPLRAWEAEKCLNGSAPSQELFEEAGRLAARQAQPISDLRASAEYRRHLVGVLTVRVLQKARERVEV